MTRRAMRGGKPCSRCRETVLRALEGLRKDKTIGSAQESVVTVTAAAADLPLLEANRELLATLCIVSEIKFAGRTDVGRPGPVLCRRGTLAARQVRTMLELSTERWPERRAPDAL